MEVKDYEKKSLWNYINNFNFYDVCAVYICGTVVDSGTCGDNATWSLNSSGTLTISGTGEIYDGYGRKF